MNLDAKPFPAMNLEAKPFKFPLSKQSSTESKPVKKEEKPAGKLGGA